MVRVDLLDPTSRLHEVTGQGVGSLVDELRDDCGLVLQSIDWVVRQLTPYDPIAAIFEPLAGDFGEVEALADRWSYAAYACGDLGGNFGALAEALPAVWSGRAATAAERRLADIAGAYGVQQAVLDLGSECLRCILTTVEAVCHGVAALLSLIDDLVLKLVAGGWGWARELATGGETVRKIIGYLDDAIALVRTLDSLVPKALDWFAEIGTHLALTEAAFAVPVIGTNAPAGGDVDDVAAVDPWAAP